jgi:hypothetical protein
VSRSPTTHFHELPFCDTSFLPLYFLAIKAQLMTSRIQPIKLFAIATVERPIPAWSKERHKKPSCHTAAPKYKHKERDVFE